MTDIQTARAILFLAVLILIAGALLLRRRR